jgi:hypothetical protein
MAVYIVLCLVAPILWGVISAGLFDLFEARRKAMIATKPTEQRHSEHWDMYEI